MKILYTNLPVTPAIHPTHVAALSQFHCLLHSRLPRASSMHTSSLAVSLSSDLVTQDDAASWSNQALHRFKVRQEQEVANVEGSYLSCALSILISISISHAIVVGPRVLAHAYNS